MPSLRVAAGAMLTLAAILSGTGCFGCSDDPKYSVASPSGRRTATVVIRNCGATTGFTTVASVSEKRLGVFSADRDLFVAKGEVAGDRYFTLKWASDDELVVTVNKVTQLFRTDEPLHGMTVRYEGNTNVVR